MVCLPIANVDHPNGRQKTPTSGRSAKVIVRCKRRYAIDVFLGDYLSGALVAIVAFAIVFAGVNLMLSLDSGIDLNSDIDMITLSGVPER